MVRSRKYIYSVPALLLLPLVALLASGPAKKSGYTGQLQAVHLDERQVNFIRPGIIVKVVSAAIAQDGTITARVTITDPKGLPLDMAGITTPGAVTLRFIAAYIPAGKKQFVPYTTTTAKATINNNPSQIQAATDSGGTFKTNADGDYTYTFKTKAPANFDATATHAIGVIGAARSERVHHVRRVGRDVQRRLQLRSERLGGQGDPVHQSPPPPATSATTRSSATAARG